MKFANIVNNVFSRTPDSIQEASIGKCEISSESAKFDGKT